MEASEPWEVEEYTFEDMINKRLGSLLVIGGENIERNMGTKNPMLIPFEGSSGVDRKPTYISRQDNQISAVDTDGGHFSSSMILTKSRAGDSLYDGGTGGTGGRGRWETKGSFAESMGFAKSVETRRFFVDDKNASANKVLLSTKSSGNSGAKFKVLCIGDLMADRNGDVCMGIISYGPMVCIHKNCQKNHLGGKSDLGNNNICVIKIYETSLFSKPTILQEQVKTTLFAKWMLDRATLEEWMECFGVAASSKAVLSEDALLHLKQY
jgi:hypothetical protein